MQSDLIMSFLPLILSNNINVITYLLVFVQILFTYQHQISKYWESLIDVLPSRTTKFYIKGSLAYKHACFRSADFSDTFLSIARQIKKSVIESECLVPYKIKEFQINYKKDKLTFFHIKNPISISKEIFIYTNIDSKLDDRKEYEYINLEIFIETNNKFDTIESFLKTCLYDYNKELIDNAKQQQVFIYEDIYEDEAPTYQEYPFETTKSFANSHFEDKDKILKIIDNFMNNKNEYMRLGLPYTMGILLHGVPGTGKTSFIKSLAKHTNRHIVILPMKQITSINQLKSIFFDENINGTKIPNNKRLYVFEDIDCGSWKQIVTSRCLKNDELVNNNIDQNKQSESVIIEAFTKLVQTDIDIDNGPNKRPKKKNDKQEITLGDFLELLDGVIEIPGRMIIMSTNHVDSLDPALIRPGRIDLTIEFKKLSKKMVADIYKQWFYCDMDNYVYNQMKDYVYTQAEIGNLFSNKSVKEINKILKNS